MRRRPSHGRWRGRWRRSGPFRLVWGIHRKVVGFLLLAAALGAAGGFGFHAAWASGAGPLAGLAVVGGVGLVLWPLAWVAVFRIARPVSHLARVAGAMRDGALASRSELPLGDDEVGEVAEALDEMAARVARQLSEQRSLMAAVSHELRSPLGRLRVMVELSREQGVDMHDGLQQEIDGMDALVGDLLAASRIDFEALTPIPLLAGELAIRAVAAAEVDPAVLQSGPAVEVRVDPTLTVRALRVMLDNARRHGGGVTGLCITQADGVRFSVEDDGPGFAAGEEEQAFQPFWRRGPEVGVGLGLALVRRIAEAHGGRAGAENRAEGGARVWIELPAA